MEEGSKRSSKPHCLVLAYPVQGHINPMVQFSKRLEHKGAKVTLVTTKFMVKTVHKSSESISFEAISDGFDEGGRKQAASPEDYLSKFREVGTKTLSLLIEKLRNLGSPVHSIVYDAFISWALDVAKEYGLVGAAFFTQSCAVDTIYYHVQRRLLKIPVSEPRVSIPRLPPLEPADLPSFIYDYATSPGFFNLVVDQFANVDKADWLLCNSFYELEKEVVERMSNILPLKTIGPTVPSMYLDRRLLNDKDYGLSVYDPNIHDCLKWLNDRPNKSVVYVSFGSLAELPKEQMEELALALKECNYHFLWVVRTSELPKLPKAFNEQTSSKGLVVSWCPQLEVLSHEAVGCFVTHCGWNSVLEALGLGVPMVAMPRWSDQSTNAKFVTDIWKVGLMAHPNEKGMVEKNEILRRLREIMEGERGKEMCKSIEKWKQQTKLAVDQGGSSDRYIDEFVAELVKSSSFLESFVISTT